MKCVFHLVSHDRKILIRLIHPASKELITVLIFNIRLKIGGSTRMYEISKRETFYKQEYCGCIYSLRGTNKWRESKGHETIKICEEFYN